MFVGTKQLKIEMFKYNIIMVYGTLLKIQINHNATEWKIKYFIIKNKSLMKIFYYTVIKEREKIYYHEHNIILLTLGR